MSIAIAEARPKLHRSGMFKTPDSLYGFEDVTLVVRHVMPLEKLKILLLKRFSAMMRPLIANVVRNAIKV